MAIRTSIRQAVYLGVLLLLPFAGRATEVVRCPDSQKPLTDRWQWAMTTGSAKESHYFIGYSIPRLMDRNSFIGSFFSERRRNHPSLGEVLGLRDSLDEGYADGSLRELTEKNGETVIHDRGPIGEKVLKHVGILVEVSGSEHGRIEEVRTSNLSLHVDLDNEPLYWLGETDDASSIRLLETLYQKVEGEHLKKNLISAIGLHSPGDLNIGFLSGILKSDEQAEIRKDAAFWLGQTQAPEALDILKQSAENDRSSGVRENAVFAISQMKSDAADDVLIALAKQTPDLETRKKAIFWLGQKASKKAVATLEVVATSEEDAAVQKSAVFALSQLPDAQGIDPLIKIATTHKNPKVRKEAIFWLGQSENDRAIQTLVDILKK